MKELKWIEEARRHIGLKEIVGANAHNPTIVQWLKEMGSFPGASKSWYFEDETPWCGLFVGYCLGKAGRAVIKDWYRAKAWAAAGLTKLNAPAYGCLGVKTRRGGGHVFFVVGKDAIGRVLGLSGNQGNMVSIVPFDPADIDGYYWPSKLINGKAVPSFPTEARYQLPFVAATAKQGASEA
ncbi:TPA: TIGR02594 family protein [Neisseria meningitidis]